jgi:uncharacterized small protein (DUF1192 family)
MRKHKKLKSDIKYIESLLESIRLKQRIILLRKELYRTKAELNKIIDKKSFLSRMFNREK